MKTVLKGVIVGVLGLFFLILLFTGGNLMFFGTIFNWIQNGIQEITRFDVGLCKAIAALFLAFIFVLPFGKGLLAFTPIPQRRKGLYRFFIFIGIAAFFSLTFFASRNNYFDPATGRYMKYYSELPNGVVRFYSEGGYDPMTGDALKPVTPDVIIKSKGLQTQTTTPFNKETGDPMQYYCVSSTGDYMFFDRPGFDPITGDSLKKVTKEVVLRSKGLLASENYQFDPKTGKSRMYYSRLPNGEYKFYYTAGYDPITGDKLRPVTKDVVLKSKGLWNSQNYQFDPETGEPVKFYCELPNGHINFYSAPGYDTISGDKLKKVTKEIVLKSKGLLPPDIITNETPTEGNGLKAFVDSKTEEVSAVAQEPDIFGDTNQLKPAEPAPSLPKSTDSEPTAQNTSIRHPLDCLVTFNNETSYAFKISDSSGKVLDIIHARQTKRARITPGDYYHTGNGVTKSFTVKAGESKRLNFLSVPNQNNQTWVARKSSNYR